MTESSRRQARLAALRQCLKGAAVVITDPASVNWLTGLRAQGHRLYGNTPLVAVAGEGGVRVVVHGCDLAWVAGSFDPGGIHHYGDFVYAGERAPQARTTDADIGSAAVRALDAVGADEDVVIDGTVPWKLAREFEAAVAPRTLSISDGEILAARRVKDDEELDAMRRANRAAEAGILAAAARMRAGVTESELLARVRREIVAHGAEPQLGSVGIGERGALVDAEPSDRALRRGEPVRFDIGCTVDGYHADLSRTAVLAPMDPWISESYQALLTGERAAIGAVKPGALPSELFDSALEGTRSAGIADYDRSHCGHGIGATVYEPPLVGRFVDAPALEPGMTLCLETPWYVSGEAGLQVEDAVVVTETGFERLGDADQELIAVT